MRNETGCFLQNIQLVNFMCHDNLYVEFTKKVTCIVGNNGSGKSAIMIAVGVLFGVRATSMRGNSYKQYIKTGEDYSLIKAEIKVPGASGDSESIVIEKRLSPESSRIRILINGEVAGKTQDDLNTLTEQLRINLKNPVCFLTQDQSKKILKVHNLKSIYAFFKSATDIENIEDNQVHDQNLVRAIKQSLDSASERQANKEKTLEAVENRLKLKEEIHSAEEAIRRLKVEHAWGKVHKEEKKRIEAEREREALLNKYSTMSQTKKELLSKIEETTGKLSELTQKRNSLQVRREARFDIIKESMTKNERRKSEISKELDQYTYEIDQLSKKIATIEQILGRSSESEKSEESEEVLMESLKLLESEKAKNEKEQMSLEVQKAQIELTIGKIQREIDALVQQNVKREGILQSYRQHDPIKFYGSSMEAAISEIKQRKLDVIGPIGLEISVKDKKWSKAIESALGSCVFGFILHSQEVKTEVTNIFVKYRVQKYQIYLTKPQKERAEDRIFEKAMKVAQSNLMQAGMHVSSPVTTVLSQIQNSSAIVVEQLIILLGIEKIGLLENRRDGYLLLQKKTGFDFFLTPAPDRIQYVGTSLSDMRCTVREKQLLVSKEGEKELMQEIENTNTKKNEIAGRLSDLSKESRDIQKTLQTHLDTQIVLRNKIVNLEERITRNKKVQGDQLQIEYKQYLEEMNNIQKQKSSVNETYKEVLSEIGKNQREIIKIQEETEYAREEEDHLYRKELRARAQENEQLKLAVQESEAELGSLQKRIDRMNIDLEEMHKECQILRESAMDLSDQQVLIVEKEPGVIEKEIIDLTAKTYAYSTQPSLFEIGDISEELQGDEEQRILKEKKKELECEISRITEILQENRDEIKEIEKGTLERVKKRESFTYQLSDSSMQSFSDLMRMREYTGTLEYNHKKEELDIKVKISNKSKGDKSSLSGGERSFSGICFLLSLWPLISSPLRILDEFDVFMDGLNRKAALNLIFEAARRINTQIIIITPLGVSNPPEDICNVVTLKPPQR
ncbi:structural maintenance of chromosomes protein 6 [Nematocida sp. AWRm78]|nr:structural maintenance of chromosomes protein 6 [Nematocida sp. AWRm79]KAI5184498.1 structural maintenance of chromosomes protein 6 [Nematocida sp. AWRm78]